MATPAQISANTRNAQQSTGPRTTQGKRTSSQNALTHGLSSKDMTLPDEDPAVFEEFFSEFLEQLAHHEGCWSRCWRNAWL